MLRDAITSGALQPSQRLIEAELSETFGLSRAAVRTALVRLEQDGLVSHERHRGAKVRLVTEREAVEIVEARAALESLAVRSAALNATKGDVAELRGLLREMRSLLKAGDLFRVSDVNARLDHDNAGVVQSVKPSPTGSILTVDGADVFSGQVKKVE